jgi:pimeloyl-ACP methyl ester carboxylesterase
MSNKAPVILIHGMWSTPEALKDVKAAFEDQGYVVQVPRLPFHLPKHELKGDLLNKLATTSIGDYVDAISACIGQLNQKPIIVGHSMGALIAQLVAAKHDCEKLILISSAPPAGINALKWSILRTFGQNLLLFPLWKKTTKLLLKNIQYGIANTQSADIHKEIVRTATYDSGKASWQISMWFLYRRPATKVNYQNIKCPVLLISGTEDRITPIKLQRKLAQKYSDKAQLKVIEGACHWTIGGTFFPEVKTKLCDWLNEQATVNA